jgi:hypothetical protein
MHASLTHTLAQFVRALPQRTATKINQEKLFIASINCATPELHPRASAFVHSGDRIKKDSLGVRLHLKLICPWPHYTLYENKQSPTRDCCCLSNLLIQHERDCNAVAFVQRLSRVIQNDAVDANALMHLWMRFSPACWVIKSSLGARRRDHRHESEIKLSKARSTSDLKRENIASAAAPSIAPLSWASRFTHLNYALGENSHHITFQVPRLYTI